MAVKRPTYTSFGPNCLLEFDPQPGTAERRRFSFFVPYGTPDDGVYDIQGRQAMFGLGFLDEFLYFIDHVLVVLLETKQLATLLHVCMERVNLVYFYSNLCNSMNLRESSWDMLVSR